MLQDRFAAKSSSPHLDTLARSLQCLLPLFGLVLVHSVSGSATAAEVPLLSPAELRSQASHIVVGTVRAVYTDGQKSGDWEETSSVAEIVVSRVEKGSGIAERDVVYAHYWNKKWTGKGDPEPHSGGHQGVRKGQDVRAHLRKKDGQFRVLLPNGLVPLQASEAAAAKKAAADDLAMVQGKWVRTIETEQGEFTILKEHAGNKTAMIITAPNGQLVEEKRSEFRLERHGGVRVFTYFNNRYTAGANAGETNNTPASYAYRVIGDTFVEARGLIAGSDEEFTVFTWQRVRD